VLIPPRLLPVPAAALLRANNVFIIECDRIWSLKRIGAISLMQVDVLFARASYAHDQATGALRADRERLVVVHDD